MQFVGQGVDFNVDINYILDFAAWSLPFVNLWCVRCIWALHRCRPERNM